MAHAMKRARLRQAVALGFGLAVGLGLDLGLGHFLGTRAASASAFDRPAVIRATSLASAEA